jgi:hypothetical protein
MRAFLPRPNRQPTRPNGVGLRVAGLGCLLAAALAVPASAQQPAYLSIERVRAALLKPPPRLIVENRQPDFRIHVEERRPFDDLFEIPLWETPVLVQQPPSLLAPIEGVPHATPALIQTTMDPTRFARSAAKSAREKSTRTQVERAIAQYCAAQPDAGASIPLCWSSTATP